jgi:cytoskeletal protein CcmA (bactofilin family)
LAFLFINGALWKGWREMLQIIEFVSLATLGVVSLLLLRRNLRRFISLSVLLAALTLAGAGSAPVQAAEFIHDRQSYSVPSGETLHGDLYLNAVTARIDGTVDGDLVFLGQSLTNNGRVTGDVIACVQTMRLEGQVDGNVRGFVQVMLLEGRIGKNLMAFVAHEEITPHGKVDGSALLSAEQLQMEGQVGRDLTAFLGHGEINGLVGGNAKLRGPRNSRSSLTIGPRADIHGTASYEGGRNPDVSPQAKFSSPLSVVLKTERPEYAKRINYWWQTMFWGAEFLLGLVLVWLFPGFVADTVRACERIGAPLGLGALALIVTPIAAVIACITIVGLGVGLTTLALYVVTLYCAQVFVSVWLGQTLLGPSTGTVGSVGRLALGLLILRAVFLVPFVGTLLKLAVILLGMGAAVLAAHRRLQPQPLTAPAVA